eukprot:2267292-Amphidinium_carterae.1
MSNITPEQARNSAPIEKKTFDHTVPASVQGRPAVRLSSWASLGRKFPGKIYTQYFCCTHRTSILTRNR